jgi:hypothetical protein
MSDDKWKIGGPEPQPGDFDEDLDTLDKVEIEIHEGSPDVRATIIKDASDKRLAPPSR